MKWEKLSEDEALSFIKSVTDKNEAALFDTDFCYAMRAPLEFYDGYCLYRIVNNCMAPPFFMDYVSNGEDTYYLDGSEAVFHKLNARQALSLNEETVADYLGFYIAYVYERGHSLEFYPKGTEDVPVNLNKVDEAGGRYMLDTELVYQNEVHKALITVKNDGSIHLEAPLKVSFLTSLSPNSKITYRHPREDDIIEGTKALIASTGKGKDFLRILEDSRAEIRVISSPNYIGLTVGTKIIYITMPSIERTAKYAQAIILACHIQDLKQNLEGFTRPPKDVDPDTYITFNYGKNLDAILETCIMIEEYELQNAVGALNEVEVMGLTDLYEAYKAGKDVDVTMPLYEKLIERMG